MHPMNRAVHFDFHTMPGITNFGENFNAETFAQTLSDARVDYINFFAHCNLGFAYYETKLGIPYPSMQGDMLSDVVTACHARGIGVSAYINVGLMHEQANLHPEWLRVDKEGKIYRGDRIENNFFRAMCYNQPGYRRLALGLIREICAYDIDGLFCDCMHCFPCHCPQCTRDMLALGLDPLDEQTAYEFSRRDMLKLCGEIKAIVGSNKRFIVNGSPMYQYSDLNTHYEIECLPGSFWGYDYLGARAAYARNIYSDVSYMTGRFQKGWGDFGGYKGRASLENDVYDALINNIKPSVGDHLHPACGPEKRVYDDVKRIYERVEALEKYTGGARYMADIGVLTDASEQLGQEYSGLARMFSELKLSFDIVNGDMDLSRFKLIALPDEMLVDSELAHKLKTLAQNGVKILSAGYGGLKPDKSGFALNEYAVDYLGDGASPDDYFAFERSPDGLADMRWSTYAPGIVMRARDHKDIRARRVTPYFERHYDGLHGYCYIPPKGETDTASAIVAGGIARISFKVFKAYIESASLSHKMLVKQLIDELLPEPLLRPVSGLPSTSRAALTGKGDYALLHIKTTFPEPRGKLGVIEEHVALPEGARIAVRGEYAQALLLPERAPLKLERYANYSEITLPRIEGYAAVLLK